MAKVYSWEVSINPYAYAYIVHPNDTERAYVGTELKGNNLQKVIDWVAECSDEDYIEHFNMVKELCEEKNYSVKFENVNAYMDVNTSCDNLRGPAGKGIINITLTNSTELADTYTINYTDGTNTSFVVRHGKQGEQGEQGKPGDNGVPTYFAMIYTSGRDELDQILGTVDTPTGGTYDWTSKELYPPGGWYESDSDGEGNALKPPVWMSSRTFIKGHEEGGWSKPTMISGENGKPGVDGASLEFIYTRVKPNEKGEDIDNDENIPGFVPTTGGWTNHPLGVDEDNRTEWFTTRLYNKTKEKWGGWNNPAIWSQYGVNGQDGDGVEYIYYLADNATPPYNPTPNYYKTNEEYKKDEWTPSKIGGAYINKDNKLIPKIIADKWTDNPTSVDATNQWEWVAVRKYKRTTEEGTTKEWGEFSDPSLWSKYGEDGQPGANATTIRKVYKMTRSTSDVPAPPTDNLYTDWSNAFPVGYTIDQCVWCCEAEIWANNNEFVEKYIRVSEVDEDGNIVPPSDATTGNTEQYPFFDVPNEDVTSSKGKKYLQLRKKTDNPREYVWGHYYEWKGGWSKPYLVTGTKGVDATPMDYVTYVFYYGDRNNPPTGEPIGETGEGKTLEYIKTYGWIDFPDTKNGERVDNDTNCWYQCCLAMNSDNTIKSWGGIHPCNGKDGDALPGKYTEFRFKVTNNVNGTPDKPELTNTDRTARKPEGWVATTEDNFPTLNDNQTMWQIFAVINPNGNDGNGGVTDVVEEEWKGPIQVSAENGKDSTVEGPAGKQGVSGIPGANFKVKYCLGTFSENTGERYWKNNEGKMYPWQIEGDEPYGNGYFGANVNNGIPKHDSDDWYDFIPNTEIVVCDITKGDKISNYRNATYLGRVIKRINNHGNICYLQIVLRVVYNPNVDSGETYTKRTTWTQAEYDAYDDAEKPYSYYENGKVWRYNHRQVSIDALENEGEDVVENFHVYVWCVQGTETWKKGDVSHNPDGTIKLDENKSNGITWGVPFKLQGTNGLNGLKGADGRSQTVYPMGVYDSNEVYLTTESKAPYVYDPNDSNFYVLNKVNQPWVGVLPTDFKKVIIHPSVANSGNTDEKSYTKDKMPTSKTKDFIIVTDHKEYIRDAISGTTDECTSSIFYYQWNGSEYKPASYYKYAYGGEWIKVSQDGTTPCQNYQNNIIKNQEPAWVKFESFEALYTSIGIIENGMIGSAVYNNEFMFSQQGIDENGNITNYASESAENGGGFLSGYEYDKKGEVDESGVTTGKHWKYKGTETYISDDDVNPYEMKVTSNSTTPVHSFRPNITLNFKTGQAYLSTGEITFGNGVMTADTGIFRNVVINGTYNRQITHINLKSDDFDDYMTLSYMNGRFSNEKIYSPFLLNVGDVIFLENIDGTISFPYMCPYFDEDKNQLVYLFNRGVKKEKGKIEQMTLDDLRTLIGRQIYIFSGIQSGYHNQAYITGSPVIGTINETNGETNPYRVVNPYADCEFNEIDLVKNNEGDFTIYRDTYGNLIGYPIETNEQFYPSVMIRQDKCLLATCVLGKYYYKIPNKDDTYSTDMITWVFQELTPFYETSYGKNKITKEIYNVTKENYNGGIRYKMDGEPIDSFTIEEGYSWTNFMNSRYNGIILYNNEKYLKYNTIDNDNILYFDISTGTYKNLYRGKVYHQTGYGNYVEHPGDTTMVNSSKRIPSEDITTTTNTDGSTSTTIERYYIVFEN